MSAGTASPPSTPSSKARYVAWIVPVVVIVAAIVLVLVVAGRWNAWTARGDRQRTTDAYVHADVVPLSTRVSDTLRAIRVQDYQTVRAGQLVAELDDTDYRAQLAQAQAALSAARAALHDNQVQKQVQAAKIAQARDQQREAQEAVTGTASAIAGADAQVKQAAQERARQEALFAQQATTRQTLEKAVSAAEQANAALGSASASRSKAEAAVLAADAAITEGEEGQQLLDAKDQSLRADIEGKAAAVRGAQVQVDYTRIYAPVDGRVTERKAFPGQLISPGMEVISLVEGDVWVQANFQETQLVRMRVGDAADVRVDAVPGRSFHGRVVQIAPASGSQTALLPPDNATGNFTRVVQRLPVKIAFTDERGTTDVLRPGFSCEVTVHPSATGRGGR
ncbi:HlyD family secretion protein [Acidipila sp. EB88]|uniref:HlyD family secretion protein n=1 Tax=Acidipila sp. EB88 TaxID=2305226 RepID=UPI001315A37D|nr:HlyD family secretion protein [Acidipila sp. EB88]